MLSPYLCRYTDWNPLIIMRKTPANNEAKMLLDIDDAGGTPTGQPNAAASCDWSNVAYKSISMTLLAGSYYCDIADT